VNETIDSLQVDLLHLNKNSPSNPESSDTICWESNQQKRWYTRE